MIGQFFSQLFQVAHGETKINVTEKADLALPVIAMQCNAHIEILGGQNRPWITCAGNAHGTLTD